MQNTADFLLHLIQPFCFLAHTSCMCHPIPSFRFEVRLLSSDGGDASPAFASGKQATSRKEESSWKSTLLLLDEKFSLVKTSSPESSTSDMVEEIYVTTEGSE
ncbi:hypothetical protein YC2023_050307 [Brassica napus]